MSIVTIMVCSAMFVCCLVFLWWLRDPDGAFLGRMAALLVPFTGPSATRFVRFLIPGALVAMWASVFAIAGLVVDDLPLGLLVVGVTGIPVLAGLLLVVQRTGRPTLFVPREFKGKSEEDLREWMGLDPRHRASGE